MKPSPMLRKTRPGARLNSSGTCGESAYKSCMVPKSRTMGTVSPAGTAKAIGEPPAARMIDCSGFRRSWWPEVT